MTTKANNRPDLEKIADRVRKLFALAEKNGNENEAAAALDKARALLREHGLEEATTRGVGPEKEEVIAPCVDKGRKLGKRWANWWGPLAFAAAEMANAGCFREQSRGGLSEWGIVFYGQPADVAAAMATFEALRNAAEAAAKRESRANELYEDLNAGGKRRWTASFKLGFADRIQERAKAQRKAEEQSERDAIKRGAWEIVAQNERWGLCVASKKKALEAYKLKAGLQNGRTRQACSNSHGYAAGQAAGSRHGMGRVSGLLGR